MDWGAIVKESLRIGALLGAVITLMIVASFMINKEMWLKKYPADVRARWGPISEKAKRQSGIFAILFFGVLIATIILTVIRLEALPGRPPSFLAIFASIVIVLALFNLVDAVIIDWLILQVLWPGLAVLPGTAGMPGYKDGRQWAINLVKGFALAPVAGVLTASVVFLFFR
jgi:hypothetical protein